MRLAWILTGLVLYGQEPAIRVSTQLVQVNVVVEGDGGRGLTKDDFVLFDGGRPQPIAVFVAPLRESALRATPPPGTFTNRHPRSTAASIVLLDLTNTAAGRQERAKQQVIKALDQVEPNTSVALYVLDGRLWILHEFTQSTAHLKEALSRYRTAAKAGFGLDGGSGGLAFSPALAGTALNQMAVQADAQMASNYTARRIDLTLAALEAIARHVKPYQGRKSLVWIAGTFPAALTSLGRMRMSLDSRFGELSRLLNEADLAIYGVDDTGLATSAATQAESGMNARAARAPRAGTQATGPTDEGIRSLAELSGGRAFAGRNDIAAAVRSAIADTQAGYTLGFYPAAERLDGKFHALRVQVRRKGVTLRHRKGYFAVSDERPDAQRIEAEIAAAARSPFDASAIGLEVQATSTDQPKPGSLRLVIRVEVGSLGTEMVGERRTGAARLLITQHTPDGRAVESSADTVRLNLSAAEHQQLLKDGLILAKHIVPVEGATHVRVLLADAVGGSAGSILIPDLRGIVSTR